MLSQTRYLLTLTSGVISDWQCSLSPVVRCFLSGHFSIWDKNETVYILPFAFDPFLNKFASLFLKGD